MQQPVQVQKKSSGAGKWLLGGCGVLVVLLVCCIAVGAVVYVSGAAQPVVQPLMALLGLASKAQAAALAPAESPMFMSVDIDLKQAVNFQRIANIYQSQTGSQKSLDDIRKQFNDNLGCDFDTDIASWWGPDMAVFLTDATGLSSPTSFSSSKASSSAQPNLVVAIGARDKAKAEAALQKCSKVKTKSTETYKGTQVNIYDSGAAAVFKNYMMIGTTKDALYAAIDTYNGDRKSSLADNADYKDALAKLPENRVATFYMTTEQIFKAYADSLTGITPQGLDQIMAYKAMAGSLSFVDNGVRMDVAMTYDTAKMADCTKQLLQTSNPGKVLNAIPGDSYVAISGANIKGVWDCTLSQMDATTRKQMQTSLDQTSQQFGIDINADLLSWMTGEYGLAVTPSKTAIPGMPSIGALLLFDGKDQSVINTKMDKMNVVFSLAGAKFKDQDVKGKKMKVATTGTGSSAVTLGYGFTDNYFVFGLPLDALELAADASKNPLATQDNFTKVKAVLPSSNTGYYYVNVAGIDKLVQSLVSGKDKTTYQSDIQPWLKPIKAVGLSMGTGSTTSPVVTVTMFAYIPGE